MHQPQDVGPRFGNVDYVHPRSPMVSHSRSPDLENADNGDFEPLMKCPTVSYKYDFQFGETDDEIRTFLRDVQYSRPRALSFSGHERFMESHEPARARISSFTSALESLGDADLEPQMSAPIITQKMGIRWGDNDDEVADFIRANEKKKASEASDADHHDQVSLSPEQPGSKKSSFDADHDDQVSLSPEQPGSKKSSFDADHDDQVSLSSEKPGSEAGTDNKTESDVDMEDQSQ
ncbi:hypothetical protein CGCSCA4_v009186 [Colletotrichum siamense]|uniref:Uncharacterized protein n=1 Tax=Colletotrichum siamense TaxID=690259 RepID=A0A9P5ENT8_COLSI|nr:hypothetical protein CGCSCA4_v009186 [Colletotrichum siamense]KAF4855574.1 hypothetical protein CGCSCA2_v008929 [Colletotrichum siamense]